MLQNAYFVAKIGADTAENEQHLPKMLHFELLVRLEDLFPGPQPPISASSTMFFLAMAGVPGIEQSRKRFSFDSKRFTAIYMNSTGETLDEKGNPSKFIFSTRVETLGRSRNSVYQFNLRDHERQRSYEIIFDIRLSVNCCKNLSGYHFGEIQKPQLFFTVSCILLASFERRSKASSARESHHSDLCEEFDPGLADCSRRIFSEFRKTF